MGYDFERKMMHTLSPNFLLVFPKETSQRLVSSLTLMHTLSPNFLLVFPKETSQRLVSSLTLTSVDNFRHTNLAILLVE